VTRTRRLLSAGRLVTLTGVGGVGKTRLALRVGAGMRRAFPDGVWFVALADLRDPDLVAVTVAEALGIREKAVSSDAPGLAMFLANKQALLVLDNCEQLIGAVADLAETLLRSCPELRILITSRQALRLGGEAALAVQPLDVPDPEVSCSPSELARIDSARLFIDRATAVLPEFEVTENNCAVVAGLCAALEGVPLAIELAVARLRVLSPNQILDRLTDRFQLLSSGTRNAPVRQQTLRALVDWSWDLCTEPEQLLWARISVFSGGVELDAAEVVCADEQLPAESILDLIASLVDKSILTFRGDGPQARYRMLEVIREYGAMRLAAQGQQTTLEARHCRWFENLATYGDRNWVGPDQARIMLRLRLEKSNLRVALERAVTQDAPELALRFAAELESHWFVRGLLSEGRYWLDRALAMPPPQHWTRVKALRVAAWLAACQNDPGRAGELFADAKRLATRLPPSVELAFLPLVEGNIATFAGDHAGAVPLFESALVEFRRLGAISGELWTLSALGVSRGLAGVPSDGYPELLACRDLAAANGEVWWRSVSLWGLSVLRWRDGDNAGAAEAAKESLKVHKLVEDEQFGVSLSLESLAWIAGSERRDRRAAQLLGASDRLWSAMRTSLSSSVSMRGFHDECVAAVRARMTSRGFQAAYRRGTQLPTREAVAFALEQPTTAAAQQSETEPDFGLTRRERDVAKLIAEGLSNREIATRLVVAQRTAEGHVENILSKLGFTSRAQVAGWLARQSPPH